MTSPIPGPVAVYIRVSTEDQADRGTPQIQRGDAERFAAFHDLPVADFYADEGVSGMVPLADRPEGARLLRDARAGRFLYVLVWRIDRLSRRPLWTLTAIDELEKCGVACYSITESIDTASQTGKMMLGFMATIAEQERLTLIARTGAGIARKHGEGAWMGGPVPFGYRMGDDGGLVVSERLMPDSRLSEADAVRLLFRLSGRERLTNSAIAKRLNAEQVPTPAYRDGQHKRKGATPKFGWQAAKVRRILVSSLYIGQYEFGRSAVRQGKRAAVAVAEVPSIVAIRDFQAAQTALTDNLKFALRNGKREYLLRGLVKCGTCGLGYSGTQSGDAKGSHRNYYRCSGVAGYHGPYGAQGRKCPSVSIRAQALEEAVWEDIKEFRRNPGAVVERLAAQLATEAERADDLHAAILAAQKDLAAKDAERDIILGLFRRGRIAEAALDKQLDAIAKEEDDAKAHIADLHTRARSADAVQVALSGAEATLRELATVEVTDDAVKRSIMERLVKRVTVHTLGAGRNREPEAVIEYYFGSPEKRIAERISRRSC